MMGVPEDEVDQVIQNSKVDLRIAGFNEEERRLRLRMSDGPRASLRLPQGPYIFCNFRTLQIPGLEVRTHFIMVDHMYLRKLDKCIDAIFVYQFI